MPFLRPAATRDAAAIELRSSRTLIGAAAATCDVVLRDPRGALEVHALLSLSPARSSGSLVPFSAAEGGACFLNGRPVPPEGVRVVHGDRLAFGDPAANAFVFELSSRARAGPLGPHAASDADLSEYVERKLRERQQRRSRSRSHGSESVDASNLLRGGRAVLEPPPSLPSSVSESVAASTASPLKASALQRPPLSAKRETAERNYAEVEKLRLAQRMQQLNRVLNGDLAFGESYLAGAAAGAEEEGNGEEEEEDEEEEEEEDDDELPDMMDKPARRASLRQSVALPDRDAGRQERSERRKRSLTTAHALESSGGHGRQEEAERREGGEGGEGGEAPTTHLLGREEDARDADSLTDSLPGFSEPARVCASEAAAVAPRPKTALHQKLIDQAIGQRRLEALAQSFVRWRRGLRVQAQRRQRKARQLRSACSRLSALRRDHAFAAWKRVAGMQSQVVSCRLDAFQCRSATRAARSALAAWRRLASGSRRAKRLVRAAIARLARRRTRGALRAWQAHSRAMAAVEAERERQRRCESEEDAALGHSARWLCRHNARERQRRALLQWRAAAAHRSRMQTRLSRAARLQFARASRERLRRALAQWRRAASARARSSQALLRLLRRQERQRQARAMERWRLATRRARQEASAAEERARVESEWGRERQQLRERHELAAAELDAAAREKLQALQALVQRKDEAIEAMEARLGHLGGLERQVRDKDAALRSMEARLAERERRKVQATAAWSRDLDGFFEGAITKCDERIAGASEELERLLALADESPSAARFRASQFLVASMLDQKASNTNARVQVQEELLASLSELGASVPSDGVDESQVPKSASFLQDLLEQRVTRLHQLHQSVAKLAAAATEAGSAQETDAVRLRHARFLADVMAKREAQHAADMTRLLLRARLALPPPAAKY